MQWFLRHIHWVLPLLFWFLINFAAFLTFWSDKCRARKNRWRIPERTLLLLAGIGGSVGALLGMLLFRHKTKHAKFFIGIPFILLVHLAVVIYFLFA